MTPEERARWTTWLSLYSRGKNPRLVRVVSYIMLADDPVRFNDIVGDLDEQQGFISPTLTRLLYAKLITRLGHGLYTKHPDAGFKTRPPSDDLPEDLDPATLEFLQWQRSLRVDSYYDVVELVTLAGRPVTTGELLDATDLGHTQMTTILGNLRVAGAIARVSTGVYVSSLTKGD